MAHDSAGRNGDKVFSKTGQTTLPKQEPREGDLSPAFRGPIDAGLDKGELKEGVHVKEVPPESAGSGWPVSPSKIHSPSNG